MLATPASVPTRRRSPASPLCRSNAGPRTRDTRDARGAGNMPKRSAVNAALDALTSDSGSGEDDAAAVAAADGPAPVSKVNVAALHRAGYEAGPSVLFVPEQKDRSAPESWEWSNGRGSAGQQAGPTPQARAPVEPPTVGNAFTTRRYGRGVAN